MPTYKVRVSYRNVDTEDLDLMEAVAETAPNAYFGTINGDACVDAFMDAACATDAIEHLVEAIHDAAPDAEPLRAELDLVTTSEIADALKLNRETVRLWTVGKRGPGNFPKTVSVNDHQKLWAARDVWEWLMDNSLPASEARPLSFEETVDATRVITRLKRKWTSQPYLTEATSWSHPTHAEATVPVRTRRATSR